MQIKSIIKKTETLTAVYYTTEKATLMDNDGDLTIVYGDDGMCGAHDLESGLAFIGWNKNAETKIENISWLKGI